MPKAITRAKLNPKAFRLAAQEHGTEALERLMRLARGRDNRSAVIALKAVLAYAYGNPAATSSDPFADVTEDNRFTDAVRDAIYQGNRANIRLVDKEDEDDGNESRVSTGAGA